MSSSPLRFVLVVREDPCKSGRAVEALRIALGLGAGDNPMTVILLGEAPRLLSEETDDIIDVDILEKYLPSFQHLKIPFTVMIGTIDRLSLKKDFSVQEASTEQIASTIKAGDRVIAF